MPNNHKRLIVQINQGNQEGIAAIDCDSKQRVDIREDQRESYAFLCDLIGLDHQLADRYSKGRAIAAGMAAENWQQWVEAHPADDSYVWLSAFVEEDGCVSAQSLTDRREVVAAAAELEYFEADCLGWNQDAIAKQYTFVVRMAGDDWESWLSMYELEETAA